MMDGVRLQQLLLLSLLLYWKSWIETPDVVARKMRVIFDADAVGEES